MKTKLIEGTDPRTDDQEILAAINTETDSEFGGGGHAMVIGIRNNAGKIYRAFRVEGMGDYMRAVFALNELGLKDELQDLPSMREGCDSIFS